MVLSPNLTTAVALEQSACYFENFTEPSLWKIKGRHTKFQRAGMTDARPSTSGEHKTSTESRVSFDPRDSELLCPFGSQSLASDYISSVKGSIILLTPLEISLEDLCGEKIVYTYADSPSKTNAETVLAKKRWICLLCRMRWRKSQTWYQVRL